jgi:transposase
MIPASVRIFVCTEPLDMRRSFDGLARAAREVLGQDPQGGALFCFINKRANRLKILWWDRNGYCLLYKRLHKAVFVMPTLDAGGPPVIDARELARLLAGVASERRRGRQSS